MGNLENKYLLTDEMIAEVEAELLQPPANANDLKDRLVTCIHSLITQDPDNLYFDLLVKPIIRNSDLDHPSTFVLFVSTLDRGQLIDSQPEMGSIIDAQQIPIAQMANFLSERFQGEIIQENPLTINLDLAQIMLITQPDSQNYSVEVTISNSFSSRR